MKGTEGKAEEEHRARKGGEEIIGKVSLVCVEGKGRERKRNSIVLPNLPTLKRFGLLTKLRDLIPSN